MCPCPRVHPGGHGDCYFYSRKKCGHILTFFFLVSENVSWQMGVESEIALHKIIILIVYNTAELVGTWLVQ